MFAVVRNNVTALFLVTQETSRVFNVSVLFEGKKPMSRLVVARSQRHAVKLMAFGGSITKLS